MSDLKSIRTDYLMGSLNFSDLTDCPIDFFKLWMSQAVDHVKKDANAFVLSTIADNGFPRSRIVLLRGIKDGGFCFFTNYNSPKSISILENNKVSMTFFWPELEKQICINGIAEKLSSQDSDNYFNSRPYSSKIGAWVSNQSSELQSRDELEQKVSLFEKKFSKDVPRPDFWGGFKIVPSSVEFWQGRSSRLHDRFLYTRKGASWKIVRLSP